jgi:hypothetical protein
MKMSRGIEAVVDMIVYEVEIAVARASCRDGAQRLVVHHFRNLSPWKGWAESLRVARALFLDRACMKTDNSLELGAADAIEQLLTEAGIPMHRPDPPPIHHGHERVIVDDGSGYQ